jgi:hypothetical protein
MESAICGAALDLLRAWSVAGTGGFAMDHHSIRSWVLSLIAPLCALVSCAVPHPVASQALRAEAGAYELEVLVNGVGSRTYEYAGETYVLGQEGSRYVLRVHNRSGRRIEAVVAVDGLDVIDGKAGDFANKRGYLVDAYGYVDIDGWRLSNHEAAAFRFAPIGESYAAKTGSARNVGVIGVAVFPERIVRPRQVYVPPPPYVDPYSSAPENRSYDADGVGRMSESKAGAAPEREAQAPAAAPRPSVDRGRAGGSANPSKAERSDDALADAPRSNEAATRRARSGLGTEFGEAVYSRIRQVEFVRAHSSRPAALLGARYDDRAGLYALGIDVDASLEPSDLALRQSADPFPVSRRFARPPTDWRRD